MSFITKNKCRQLYWLNGRCLIYYLRIIKYKIINYPIILNDFLTDFHGYVLNRHTKKFMFLTDLKEKKEGALDSTAPPCVAHAPIICNHTVYFLCSHVNYIEIWFGSEQFLTLKCRLIVLGVFFSVAYVLSVFSNGIYMCRENSDKSKYRRVVWSRPTQTESKAVY